MERGEEVEPEGHRGQTLQRRRTDTGEKIWWRHGGGERPFTLKGDSVAAFIRRKGHRVEVYTLSIND